MKLKVKFNDNEGYEHAEVYPLLDISDQELGMIATQFTLALARETFEEVPIHVISQEVRSLFRLIRDGYDCQSQPCIFNGQGRFEYYILDVTTETKYQLQTAQA